MNPEPAPENYALSVEAQSNLTVRKALQALLRAYNLETVGLEVANTEPLTISVTNQAGEIVGGLVGHTAWEWLVIDVLALEPMVRGKGLGARLMAQAEMLARKRGCCRAHTSTYTHQALQFYQRLGYRVVGQLEDYPHGHTLVWLQKDL